MKREFLQTFQVGDQALPKEVIDAIMDENERDIEVAKKLFADYEAVKSRLEEANKTIESFKGMDIDAVRKEAEEWKSKAEQAEKDAAAKVAELAFNGKLTAAITAAKGRNAKAVMALLDLDALKGSQDQDRDIKAALEGLKKDSGYLFEDGPTPPPYAGGTGTAPLTGGVTREAFAKMGYRERLELKQSNPTLYEQVKE